MSSDPPPQDEAHGDEVEATSPESLSPPVEEANAVDTTVSDVVLPPGRPDPSSFGEGDNQAPDVGTGRVEEPANDDQLKPDPAQPDPVQPDPVYPDLAQPDPVQPDLAQPDLAQPDPVQPDLAQPDPVQPDPAQPDPVQPDPVQPAPAQGDETVHVEEKAQPGQLERVEQHPPAASETELEPEPAPSSDEVRNNAETHAPDAQDAPVNEQEAEISTVEQQAPPITTHLEHLASTPEPQDKVVTPLKQQKTQRSSEVTPKNDTPQDKQKHASHEAPVPAVATIPALREAEAARREETMRRYNAGIVEMERQEIAERKLILRRQKGQQIVSGKKDALQWAATQRATQALLSLVNEEHRDRRLVQLVWERQLREIKSDYKVASSVFQFRNLGAKLPPVALERRPTRDEITETMKRSVAEYIASCDVHESDAGCEPYDTILRVKELQRNRSQALLLEDSRACHGNENNRSSSDVGRATMLSPVGSTSHRRITDRKKKVDDATLRDAAVLTLQRIGRGYILRRGPGGNRSTCQQLSFVSASTVSFVSRDPDNTSPSKPKKLLSVSDMNFLDQLRQQRQLAFPNSSGTVGELAADITPEKLLQKRQEFMFKSSFAEKPKFDVRAIQAKSLLVEVARKKRVEDLSHKTLCVQRELDLILLNKVRENDAHCARQRHVVNCLRSKRRRDVEAYEQERIAEQKKRLDLQYAKQEERYLKAIDMHVTLRQKFMRESRDVALLRTQNELPGARDVSPKVLHKILNQPAHEQKLNVTASSIGDISTIDPE